MNPYRTLIQKLQTAAMTTSADEELWSLEGEGYQVVAEHLLMHGGTVTRVLRMKREVLPDTPETVAGKLVREHGADGADRIMQQESIDRAFQAGTTRLARYRNHSIPLPPFPFRKDQ